MTRIGHRRMIPWTTAPNPIPKEQPDETRAVFSGKHPDGTAHRLSGCPCGHEGRLDHYQTIMGDTWTDADAEDADAEDVNKGQP